MRLGGGGAWGNATYKYGEQQPIQDPVKQSIAMAVKPRKFSECSMHSCIHRGHSVESFFWLSFFLQRKECTLRSAVGTLEREAPKGAEFNGFQGGGRAAD